MNEKKKPNFGTLYLIGVLLGGVSLSTNLDSDIPLLLGFFTLVFTSLAHFIVKIVSLQEEIQGGLHPSPQTQRPMFQSHRRGGNPHYDHLIRRMQLTDLSGMSVDQAATTYASFFNCGDLASKPFFSNPYVQDLLKHPQYLLRQLPNHLLLHQQQHQVQPVRFGRVCLNQVNQLQICVAILLAQRLSTYSISAVSSVGIAFVRLARVTKSPVRVVHRKICFLWIEFFGPRFCCRIASSRCFPSALCA